MGIIWHTWYQILFGAGITAATVHYLTSNSPPPLHGVPSLHFCTHKMLPPPSAQCCLPVSRMTLPVCSKRNNSEGGGGEKGVYWHNWESTTGWKYYGTMSQHFVQDCTLPSANVLVCLLLVQGQCWHYIGHSRNYPSLQLHPDWLCLPWVFHKVWAPPVDSYGQESKPLLHQESFLDKNYCLPSEKVKMGKNRQLVDVYIPRTVTRDRRAQLSSVKGLRWMHKRLWAWGVWTILWNLSHYCLEMH